MFIRILIASLVGSVLSPFLSASDWQPVPQSMLTTWGEALTPATAWQEYPRPALKRLAANGQPAWTNLNGLWDYAVTPLDAPQPAAWAGRILVPFALEAPLSGVGRLLQPTEALWYHRTFTLTNAPTGRLLLNFEAVDYQSEVWLNGQKLGAHTGGNLPFSFDISAHARAGENTLVVRVIDATDTADKFQLNGKQHLDNKVIWYTRVSGIWQTVWLETAPAAGIADVAVTTDIRNGAGLIKLNVRPIQAASSGLQVRLTVRDGDRALATTTSHGSLDVEVTSADFTFWSPAHPQLYTLDVELLNAAGQVLDRVESYAGIRTVSKVRDAAGHWRFTLNGEPIFHYGPLDQGWWPDGLLTPPSENAMRSDIDFLKRAGFNLIRKHIKVEPRSYYYHCDRVGMLVWQDQVSGGANPKWQQLHGRKPDPTKAPNPNAYQPGDPLDAVWPEAAHAQWMSELQGMVDHLRHYPSIVVWTPFNERWGQHRTLEVGAWLKRYDPTRLVNIASGGNFFPIGDIFDSHAYPNPEIDFNYPGANDYVKVIGEFGGHGWPVEGHLWGDQTKKKFVYGKMPTDLAEYIARYEKTLADLIALKARGVSAGVYTQTTDVEVEINGLLTYDRKVTKIPVEHLAKLHTALFAPSP